MSETCRNCTNALTREKYKPYCLDCWNSDVPAKDAEIERLREANRELVEGLRFYDGPNTLARELISKHDDSH